MTLTLQDAHSLNDKLTLLFKLHQDKRIQDNTNWRAGGSGGLCFQMKNVNFRKAALKTEGRPVGCTKRRSGRLRKRAGWAAEKGSPPARPFP